MLTRAIHNKTNPNQESSITCYVEGILPADENEVQLHRLMDDASFDDANISRGDVIPLGGEMYAVSFTIQIIVDGEEYACFLKNDSFFAEIKINATAFGK